MSRSTAPPVNPDARVAAGLPALLLFAAMLIQTAPAAAQNVNLPPEFRAALEGVTAKSLEAHVSFLASDELAGRATPSPGLEAAAAYIASRFRMAGLEPVGDDGFYQTSEWVLVERRGRMRPQRIDQAPDVEGPHITLKNVVGLLRGSDPVLRDTYILITAHYDHVGIRPGAAPDSIYNGANDNATGTAAVIELAEVLARSGIRPKRSILFMAVHGEESGLLGSRWYADHPIFPLEKTAAMINLEMLGRTDMDDTDLTNRAGLTGFNLSNLSAAFVAAREAWGVEFFRHEQNSLPYFSRSDNIALASLGVVAHTVSVGYSNVDYHGPGDHWEKVDYENMARTVKTVGLATLMWAHSDLEPAWNAANEAAARYLEAWRSLHGGGR